MIFGGDFESCGVSEVLKLGSESVAARRTCRKEDIMGSSTFLSVLALVLVTMVGSGE